MKVGGGQQQVSEGASSTSGQLVRAPPQGYAFRYGDGDRNNVMRCLFVAVGL